MNIIAGLFESGRVFAVVLAFVGIEAVVLLLFTTRLARASKTMRWEMICNLLAGAGLLAAAALVSGGAHWFLVALALAAALAAHAVDMRCRLVRDRSGCD